MKRFMIGIILTVLFFSLSGCGKGTDRTGQTGSQQETKKIGQQESVNSVSTETGYIDGSKGTEDIIDMTDYSSMESKPWTSTAEYINAGCTTDLGGQIRHMTGNVTEEIVAASLTDNMTGLFTGYNEGITSLEAVLFTAKDGSTVFELKDKSTDCVILFDKMIVRDENCNSYHFFGQIKGTFEGMQYNGSNTLLQTSDGGWCEIYVCQGDKMLVDDYRLQKIPSESPFITAMDEWCGTYITDEYNTEKAEIIINADEYGLTRVDINSTIYQGMVWCFQESSNYGSEHSKVIEYSSPEYDSDCRYVTVQFYINETTGLCESVNYNIVCNAGLVNGTAYREKDYIAPVSFVNQDGAGTWGAIPVHDTDVQYFTPVTEDYLDRHNKNKSEWKHDCNICYL